MKTVLTYRCECGEDFYEDDANCCNCYAPIDKSKLKSEEYAEITYDGDTMVVPVPNKVHWICEHGIDHYGEAFCKTCLKESML
jgi:hypothetical protein